MSHLLLFHDHSHGHQHSKHLDRVPTRLLRRPSLDSSALPQTATRLLRPQSLLAQPSRAYLPHAEQLVLQPHLEHSAQPQSRPLVRLLCAAPSCLFLAPSCLFRRSRPPPDRPSIVQLLAHLLFFPNGIHHPGTLPFHLFLNILVQLAVLAHLRKLVAACTGSPRGLLHVSLHAAPARCHQVVVLLLGEREDA